jgi:hypothetical protein
MKRSYRSVRVGCKNDNEHRVIAERVLGRRLPHGVEVHHWDDNGRNNEGRNLVICQDKAYHKLIHKRQRILRLGGDPNKEWWCSFCSKLRPINLFWIRKTGRNSGSLVSGCKVCRAERHRQQAEKNRATLMLATGYKPKAY